MPGRLRFGRLASDTGPRMNVLWNARPKPRSISARTRTHCPGCVLGEAAAQSRRGRPIALIQEHEK